MPDTSFTTAAPAANAIRATPALRVSTDKGTEMSPVAASIKGRTLYLLAGQAAELLRPGGLLMYATCSIEPEENQEVVDRLLGERSDLEPAPASDGTWRRLWLPGEAVGDGFFAARMRKKE